MSLDSPRDRLSTLARGLEGLATLAGLALTTLACCNWLVIQWLALLLSALGGTAAFTFLVRLETPLLAAVMVILLIASLLARDTFSRILDLILAALVLVLAVLLLAWEQDPAILWSLPLLGWLFVHRQQTLFVAFAGAAGLRVIHWSLSHRRFMSRSTCRARAALRTEQAGLGEFAPCADTAKEEGR
jgi:hypothetical protein